MNQEIDYYSKYLKYKNKYINLKIEVEGGAQAKDYCDQVVPTLQMALEILQKAKSIKEEKDIYVTKTDEHSLYGYIVRPR